MKNPRKKALAILAGLAVTGIVGASAASLGTVSNQSLGAATEVVASCDPDGVTVGYDTSYDAATDAIVVDAVNITNVHANCAGLAWELVLTGDPVLPATSRSVLGSDNGTVGGTSFQATFTSAIDAEDVTGIAITISG